VQGGKGKRRVKRLVEKNKTPEVSFSSFYFLVPLFYFISSEERNKGKRKRKGNAAA
jgi:hypothetical protein